MPKLNNPGYDKMLNEFREFIARGNVIDLAVGVIIGGAFATITKSLTEDIIMPVVGALFGGVDFSNMFIRLGEIPPGYSGESTNYAQLKEAGVAMIGYGDFATQVVNFLIVAWVIFLVVKAANRLFESDKAAPSGPSELDVLQEIRDELRKRP